ncbi:hypothetical protein ACO3UB_08395 (plasmid) [Methanocaldococcus sp. 16A]
MKVIRFRHDYYKLQEETFTTIRGKRFLRWIDVDVGDVIRIKSPSYDFFARIIDVQYKRICDIPIELLKKDAEFEGFEIKTHEDFVRLINSFTRWKNTKLTTEKAIIYLKKVNI